MNPDSEKQKDDFGVSKLTFQKGMITVIIVVYLYCNNFDRSGILTHATEVTGT